MRYGLRIGHFGFVEFHNGETFLQAPPLSGRFIKHAVGLHFRFTLSFRDVEEMPARRGIDVTYESVRCWINKFGPKIAANLRRRKAPPSPRWHMDEMVGRIGGERMFLWRAVDDEGVVLDLIVQKRLLRNHGVEPESIVTDGLKSYTSALREPSLADRHRPGRLRENNRAKNSHVPIRRRERKMPGFKSRASAQRFLAAHAAIHNAFDYQRRLIGWRTLQIFRAREFCMGRGGRLRRLGAPCAELHFDDLTCQLRNGEPARRWGGIDPPIQPGNSDLPSPRIA